MGEGIILLGTGKILISSLAPGLLAFVLAISYVICFSILLEGIYLRNILIINHTVLVYNEEFEVLIIVIILLVV